jgi:hypothetical protein
MVPDFAREHRLESRDAAQHGRLAAAARAEQAADGTVIEVERNAPHDLPRAVGVAQIPDFEERLSHAWIIRSQDQDRNKNYSC